MQLITSFLERLSGSSQGSTSEASSQSQQDAWSTSGADSTASTSSGLKSCEPLPLASLPEMKRLVATTALTEMMRKSFFSICTIDQVADLAGINCKKSEAYRLLHALHCMDFSARPKQLRDSIPQLINEALTPPTLVVEEVDTALRGVNFGDTYV